MVRVRYQRISARRWNLILDDGVVVELPEQNWPRELGVLETLIVDKAILKRNIATIDLRSRSSYSFLLKDSTTRSEPRK